MSEKKKKNAPKPKASMTRKETPPAPVKGLWKFIVPVVAVSFLVFLPSLKNDFTNWDDILYVTQNPLLRDIDLKAIFTTPVVSNYHPLTILSLALNYQLSALNPFSYHLTSMILHAMNTALVFWFIFLLSRKNAWVSAAVALLFGIHPMHVESVAWVSERKDLLYTLFYVGALITYFYYVSKREIKFLVFTTVFGAISLLCKPAAIVLPFSLLLVDYYLRRNWDLKWILEKIPLFIMAGIMAYVTFAIQSHKAVASIEAHSFTERFVYAGFGWCWYLVKSIVPTWLSALHPFPKTISPIYYLATAAALIMALLVIWKRKNRNLFFGWGFYTVNLLLVLQIVSIGNAVVAERYTYVPYIGLFFWGAMAMDTLLRGAWAKLKFVFIGLFALWCIFLGVLTYQRIPVWKNSQYLWMDVLSQYPDSPRAWTNKGLDYFDHQQWTDAIFHLSKALVNDPNFPNALEWRCRTSLEVGEYDHAYTDAERFYKLFPGQETSSFLMARSLAGQGKSEEALNYYNDLVEKYGRGDYYNNRGALLFNKLKRYAEAKADFQKAIQLNPDNGGYYLNLARCAYVENDIPTARKYGSKAKELGARIDPGLAKALGL